MVDSPIQRKPTAACRACCSSKILLKRREEGGEERQQQKEEETWEPTGVAPNRSYFVKSNPRMGKLVKSSLVESNEIESSLVSRLQSSHLALVSLKSSLPSMSSQAQGHPRPNVCTSELFVASEPCKCKILELSVACQLSKRTAERIPSVECSNLVLGAVLESSVKETLSSVNMSVNSMSLHGGSSLALKGLGGESCACDICEMSELERVC